MKCCREFLFLAGFLICACSEPDPRMAELQRYYAQMGEGINPPVKKVETRKTARDPMSYASQSALPTAITSPSPSPTPWPSSTPWPSPTELPAPNVWPSPAASPSPTGLPAPNASPSPAASPSPTPSPANQ